MQSLEPAQGREFLTKVCDYLVSLPFDLKILQEAVANTELDRATREVAAAVLVNALTPQEGPSPERYLDDLFLLRMALAKVGTSTEPAHQEFRTRFDDVFSALTHDLELFERALGPALWAWLQGRLGSLSRMALKGKRPTQYVDDEDSWDTLYEDGLDFQTHYDVTEERVQNRLRRPEQVMEYLQRRCAEDSKKKS